MSSPAQFATKMARVSKDVRGADRGIVNRAALATKKAVQVRLAVAAPRGRLNVGKRGQKIGVRYTLLPKSAKVFMTGPAQLIERDTKPHRIPKERKTGRAKRRYAVIPGVGVRAWANHPGTKGKHPWRKGLLDAQNNVQRATADHYFDTVKKALR